MQILKEFLITLFSYWRAVLENEPGTGADTGGTKVQG